MYGNNIIHIYFYTFDYLNQELKMYKWIFTITLIKNKKTLFLA